MTHIQRSALLPYSCDQIFELVNDVASYPEYMDGCVKATILSQDQQSMSARLQLKKGGLQQEFATRNRFERPERITLELLEGPFESLRGEWQFTSLASNACKVSLDLRFKMQNSLTQKAAEKMFEGVTGNLVNALCQRAKKIYG
jgi:ribosome-associated toxin RatA of RatAB toxin-antitoxin module